MKRLISVCLLFALCLTQPLRAQEQGVSSTQLNTPPASVEAPAYSRWYQNASPSDWGLNDEEWARYLELMRGEAGLHYTHMEPIFVLGMYAQTPGEQKRFAEQYARRDAERLDRLFGFNRAFKDARARLYPNAQRIDQVQYAKREAILDSPLYSLKKPRLSIYLTTSCDKCDAVVQSLVRKKREMDLYFVGAIDESSIQQWANSMELPHNDVSTNRITLNFDDGWFETYGNGQFPSIFQTSDAGFTPVALKDVQ